MSYTNARQVIPPLFKEIVRHEAEFAELKQACVELGFIPFFPYCAQLRRRRELCRAAEKALAWNTNKGALA